MPESKPLSKDFHLCDTGWIHFRTWSALLDQKRPRASRIDISAAKRAYDYHREHCDKCTPLSVHTERG
jgi:hypothetical protein